MPGKGVGNGKVGLTEKETHVVIGKPSQATREPEKGNPVRKWGRKNDARVTEQKDGNRCDQPAYPTEPRSSQHLDQGSKQDQLDIDGDEI